MTKGKSIPQQNNYRQGNSTCELHPLNSDENEPLGFSGGNRNKLTDLLDSSLQLDSVFDENSTFGPNAITIADALLNNDFLFADQLKFETLERPILQLSNDSNNNLQQLNLPTNNNYPVQNSNPTLELKKQRRKNKELKEKATKIDVENMPGFCGRDSIEEIMKRLEPDRAKVEQSVDKKKKKKTGGVKKNNKSVKALEIGDIDVEVELDNDYSPVQTENKIDEDGQVESQVVEEQAEVLVPRSPIESKEEIEKLKLEIKEDEEKDKKVLRSTWSDFLKKYDGKIYVHDDSSDSIQEFTTKKRSNNNVKNSKNNNRGRKMRR